VVRDLLKFTCMKNDGHGFDEANDIGELLHINIEDSMPVLDL